jgi:hypothetical protein
MIAYIFKSSLGLILLFGLYWLLLRKEKLFIFNRYFLIFSLLFSLIIPFISIPVSIRKYEVQESILSVIDPNIPEIVQNRSSIEPILSPSVIDPALKDQSASIDYIAILLMLYISGVILFLIRFVRNILLIFQLRLLSEKIKYQSYCLALTEKQVNPFCFLNTIFINKLDYFNGRVAEELIRHEIEHANHLHSTDIMIIELIRIFYWFNPVLILYDRAIRINHEYLADNGVINGSSDIKDYADKLINYISCKRIVHLTSGFNPSLTRKRLLMLTKTRSGMIYYGTRVLVTISLVAVLFMVLSFTPSYSDPIRTDQDMNVVSDKKSGKAIDTYTNQYKVSSAKTENKKAENGIESLTNEKTSVTSEKSKSETQKAEKLIIVDGVVSTKKVEDIPIESIKDFRMIGEIQATKIYGEKGKNGAIEITTKGKTLAPPDIKKSETTKAESQATMEGVAAATNMNVLYLGIPNPIEIAVPGVTSDKVTATITNGTINKTTTGWEVNPSSFNDLILCILVNNKIVNEKKFRVKPIPAPVAVFAGKSNGSEPKDALIAGTLEAELKDFLWNLKFEIESFTFFFSGGGYDIEITSKGNKLTDQMKSIISDLKRGQYITFKDIKAIGPDGKPYDLNPVILKID